MAKRLFEAMIEANHRALAGDTQAGLHPADYADELPLVALTCVDARLNALLPQALGVPPEQFIWLRNAGNIITGPMSSTMRSLALACAVKGGKEIVIIGHTDCQVGKTTTLQLIDRFRALGIERHMLPDNLNEYFGIFASDRQNVLKAVEFVRRSPLIGPKLPVQGLLIDIETGKLEWLVNGYQTLGTPASGWNEMVHAAAPIVDALKPLTGFNVEAMKFPEGKIGEVVSAIGERILQKMQQNPVASAAQEPAAQPGGIPRISGPTGFKVGEIKIPESKIGEVMSTIGQEISHTVAAHAQIPPSIQGKVAPPVGPPPKIPTPPRLRPKVELRRNPK
jgi:carbonic anhydrase